MFILPTSHRIIHQYETFSPSNVYDPFILEEALLKSNLEHPVLHFWTLENTAILGMTDTRLPQLQNSLRFLDEQHIASIVRHAGGLAVIANEGVLNVSLILPVEEVHSIPIPQAYEWFVSWMQATFPTHASSIQAKEIIHSYCPGDFDLSIHGKKFAGIAQRRFKHNICVSMYISIYGNQQERGEWIRQFYQVGHSHESTSFHYPTVQPESMENLDILLDEQLSIPTVQQRLVSTLTQSSYSIEKGSYDSLLPFFPAIEERLKKRNERLSVPYPKKEALS